MNSNDATRSKLMWASFLTLVASGVGFAVRTAMASDWGAQFNIDGQQFGQIMGAGFLGFGAMIFFGGILVEALGYKKLLILAFLLHLISGIMLFVPSNVPGQAFTILYWSVFLFSIAQGLYEAVINPLIAQLYPDNKTHYLNILHAGWPGGMIIGGLIAACFVGKNAWVTQIQMWEIPLASFTVLLLVYAALAFPQKFPPTVGEAKADWLKIFSCFISPIFLLLLVLHACIGYVELGVDSWTTKLMENLLPNSVLILVYTSFLMFILRFFAGPIVHKINPIGLLFMSSIIACLGLLWLGSDISSVAIIFAAATFYSLGKAFFWPTMLGVAGERYPQSGSVAMGALGAVGMLTVGLLAGEGIGYKQASNMSAHLKENAPATFERYSSGEQKTFVPDIGIAKFDLGLPEYTALAANRVEFAKKKSSEDAAMAISKLEGADDATKQALKDNLAADKEAIKAADIYGGRRALTLTAYVPAAMAVGFLILLLYYKVIGGYKPCLLYTSPSPRDATLSRMPSSA